MLRYQQQNATGWLKALVSSPKTGCSKHKTLGKKGRKLLLEALETRRVFDAGWATTMDNTTTYDMDGDAAGNQYITGSVVPSANITLTFENLSVTNTTSNLFVAKQNANGQYLWTAFAGNSISNSASSRVIAADTSGSVFISGAFTGIAKFGSQTLTSVGDSDGFVAKLNASTGQFLWAKQFGGIGKDIGRGLEVDPNGNIVVTGGLGMAASSVNDAPTLFITKLDTNGSTLWSKTLSGDINMAGNLASPTFDSTGAIYIGGRFKGTLDLPTGSLTSVATIAGSGIPTTDRLIAKLDANGDFVWARSLSGENASSVTNLRMGPGNQLYVSGLLAGAVNYDGNALVSAGGNDGFLASLNATTGNVVWARQVGGLGNDTLSDFSVNGSGDIYAIGTFETSADFGSQTLVSDGRANAFISKISAAGQFLGSSRFITGTTSPDMTATNTPFAKGLHIDSTGELYVFGSAWYGGSTAWTGVQAPQKPITARLSSLTYIFDFIVKLPSIEPTKFYVVDDSNRDRTFQYGSSGELTIDNFSINAGNTAPRGAASNAAGTTVWVGDKNRNVYVYNSSGSLQGSWTASSLPSTAQVEGIATNGTDVWIVDNKTDKVFRHSNAASRLSGSQSAVSSFILNSANTNPKGIVTDGTYIWVVNDSIVDKVFKYSVSGSYLGSWTIDSTNKSPTGLTIDPTNGSQDIWVVDNGTDKIYQYANSRGRTLGSQNSTATYALAVGNTNPQGIADPPPASSKLDTANALVGSSNGISTPTFVSNFVLVNMQPNDNLTAKGSWVSSKRDQARIRVTDDVMITLGDSSQWTRDQGFVAHMLPFFSNESIHFAEPDELDSKELELNDLIGLVANNLWN